MTYEEEAELLEQFIHAAEGGHITDVSAIKTAYDEKIGHKTGHGQIYYVLHRHGWSRKMPRSGHPKSAAPEAIDASKKVSARIHELTGVFHNSKRVRLMFQLTLEKVVDRLCDTICDLSSDTIRRITGRNWIIRCFN